MTKKLYPYINTFTGDVQMVSKQEGAKLDEDWLLAKAAKNDKGENVLRFQIATQMEDENGVTHIGTATVDISEVKNGNRSTK
jgi:hypothetical protein